MAIEPPWSHDLVWPEHLAPFDPFDATIQADPYRHYAWLREHAPVLRAGVAEAPLYIVSRYKDVAEGLRNHSDFSSTPSSVIVPGLLLSLDPPHHKSLRETASRAFTPRAIGALEPQVKALVAQHWASILQRGGGEVIGEFASPLTISVISTVLGIPAVNAGLMRNWTTGAIGYLGALIRNVPDSNATDADYRNMLNLLSSVMDEFIGNDEDKVIANLARLREEGSLGREEAAGFAVLLFMAGHETTTILTGNCLDFLAANPKYLAYLREPAHVSNFLNELIRFRPPVHRLTRYVHKDVEFADHLIPAGASVRFLVASANRDDTKFPDGDNFLPERNNTASIGFGYGIHMCIGSWLAKLELRLILEEIAKSTGSMLFSDKWPRQPLIGGAFATVGLHALGLSVKSTGSAP